MAEATAVQYWMKPRRLMPCLQQHLADGEFVLPLGIGSGHIDAPSSAAWRRSR